MADLEQISTPTAEPPHSIESASVDEKGRLKLPAKIVEYLTATGGTQVFISTRDLRTVTIYPLSRWKHNENVFDDAGEDAAAAERVALLMKYYGGDAEVDKSGRVLLPALLREELGLEKQPVVVHGHRGLLIVMSKRMHEEQVQAARATLLQDVGALQKKGFK